MIVNTLGIINIEVHDLLVELYGLTVRARGNPIGPRASNIIWYNFRQTT